MYGKGILKGLSVTLKRFSETYLDDIVWWLRGKKRYYTTEGVAHRSSKNTRGIFTVQYPEEQLITPEEFRYVPFLVYDEGADGKREHRCTSCGICAKVCPPQCIWIVRTNDPNTGKPVPEPKEFYIDMDICMNCGFCAEFCPFDAIKMDHDYELASYDRTTAHIFDKARLSKEFRYWQSIAPTRAAEEAEARGGWEHKDVLKQKQRDAKEKGKAAE